MKKERITKAVGILTIISAVITLISGIFNFLLPMYLLHKFQIDANGASSIGIIGGADGPTAIYVAGQSSSYSITVIFVLITIAGIAYRIFIIKPKK